MPRTCICLGLSRWFCGRIHQDRIETKLNIVCFCMIISGFAKSCVRNLEKRKGDWLFRDFCEQSRYRGGSSLVQRLKTMCPFQQSGAQLDSSICWRDGSQRTKLHAEVSLFISFLGYLSVDLCQYPQVLSQSLFIFNLPLTWMLRPPSRLPQPIKSDKQKSPWHHMTWKATDLALHVYHS